MGLITCPDCRRRVSDRATACPQCGAPISTAGAGTPVQAVERTAKRLKGELLISACAIGCGVLFLVAGERGDSPWTSLLGRFCLVAGAAGLVYTLLRIWWHHH